MLPMQMQQPGSRAPPKDDRLRGEPAASEVAAAAVAVDACLAVAFLAGASLLTWWSIAFHPSNSMLWMVPVGLVLACTPVVVCLALSFSDEPRVPAGGKGSDAGAEALPLSAVVVEK